MVDGAGDDADETCELDAVVLLAIDMLEEDEMDALLDEGALGVEGVTDVVIIELLVIGAEGSAIEVVFVVAIPEDEVEVVDVCGTVEVNEVVVVTFTTVIPGHSL